MSLNQTLTITIVYQTHNNNNYPKHKTITINKNKVNKIIYKQDKYKYMWAHNSPFQYTHSFSFLYYFPPNYVLLSPFLAWIAKGFLLAFVE